MDGYRLYESTLVLDAFVDALSNWWVRRNRDRFWAPGLAPDKLDAHWTLCETLVALAKLLAPFLPFASEEIWQNLVRRPLADAAEESVHLCDYPAPDASAIDRELSRTMGAVREIVSLGLQVRTAAKLRVRQPLAAAEIVLTDPALEPALREHLGLVRDELNVHAVHFAPRADDYVRYVVKPNFRALGPKVGKRMPALKAALAAADGAALLRQLESDGRCTLVVEGSELALGPEEISVSLEALPGFAVGERRRRRGRAPHAARSGAGRRGSVPRGGEPRADAAQGARSRVHRPHRAHARRRRSAAGRRAAPSLGARARNARGARARSARRQPPERTCTRPRSTASRSRSDSVWSRWPASGGAAQRLQPGVPSSPASTSSTKRCTSAGSNWRPAQASSSCTAAASGRAGL